MPWIPAGPLAAWAGQDAFEPSIDFGSLGTRDHKALDRCLHEGGRLLLPSSSGYRETAAIHTANQQIDPPLLVRPRTSTEISRVLGWCRDRHVFPRVRSGGHSYAGYSTGDTLVIDLRDMKDLVTDAGGIAAVGSGASLGEVARRLHCDADRRLPAGTCPTVGISGLTMVGGHGPLTNRHGLTLDRLVAAEVVLADGSVTICNEVVDAPLFWALRGGGSGSFGVVTRLWFDTVPGGIAWQGAVRWDWTDFPEVWAAWSTWIDTLPSTAFAAISFKAIGTGGQVIVVTRDETREADVSGALQALVDAIPAVPIQGPSVSTVSAPDCSGTETLVPTQARRKSLLATSAPSGDVADIAIAWRQARFEDPALAAGPTATMLTIRWSGALQNVGSTETAWVHRDAGISTQLYSEWPSDPLAKARDAATLRWMRGFHDDLRPHYDLGAYQGYWDPDIEDWPQQYYGENFDGLVTVKNAYDPGNFFRFPRSIPVD